MMEDGLSLISVDEAVRARSVAYVKDVVTLVKELDGRIVTIVPGEIGNLGPQASPEDEWRWAIESMCEIYDYATPAGIRLAIEPINRCETYFINRIDQALALAEAVGPDCGVCPDTFHLNIEEPDPLQAILDAGERIADFHVSDSNQLACGMGHLDWTRILETLRATGYTGAIAVEFVPTIDRTPVNRDPDSVEDYRSKRISEELYTSMVRQSADLLHPLMG
jgi:sugar phosphate isomerase/epimerase